MAEASTRTVERALTLLAGICDRGSATLADSARAAGLPASTALRLLRTLETTGFIRRDDDGLFRPGSRLVQLGAQALSQESLISMCREPMERLVAATGESAYLSVYGPGPNALYIAIVEGTHSVRHASWVGRTVPLEGSAIGRVLRDDIPEEGFVWVERGIEKDVTAIAAPVRAGRRVVAALSLVVPSYRITPPDIFRCGQLVLHEAQDLSASFGPAPAPARGQDHETSPATGSQS